MEKYVDANQIEINNDWCTQHYQTCSFLSRDGLVRVKGDSLSGIKVFIFGSFESLLKNVSGTICKYMPNYIANMTSATHHVLQHNTIYVYVYQFVFLC